MKLKSIPRRLGYILGAQWTRDLSWTLFTILLSRQDPFLLGQIMLALGYGYLVKTAADVGLNEFLLSSFARRDARPTVLLGEVLWLKCALLVIALGVTWFIVASKPNYSPELRLIVLCIAAGFGIDGISDTFFALCQARGRQDVEMRIRIPAAVLGIGFGIVSFLLGAPPLVVALYKVVESSLCFSFGVRAIGRNPFSRFGWGQFCDLAQRMRSGLIFTGMAACSMFYNKLNLFFLKDYGGEDAVAAYGVAWEMVEGLSMMISSALLGKVIFPMLSKLWKDNRDAFRALAGQTARSLWAAALPMIYVLCVENDRIFPLIYGEHLKTAVTAQRLLTPCLATAFLHNLAAYAMIGMRRHCLLFCFYLSGLAVNIFCCYWLIPQMPLEGAALALTVTKVWVAILTVSFFQATARPMTAAQWGLMLAAIAAGVGLWYGCGLVLPRELAEIAGLLPLLALLWRWRPPSAFERSGSAEAA